MIIVIVVLRVALVGVTTSLYPRSKQSAEQVLSVKAAELGRAVLDEVFGRVLINTQAQMVAYLSVWLLLPRDVRFALNLRYWGKRAKPVTRSSMMWMTTSHQAQYPSKMYWVRIVPLNTNALSYRYTCFMYLIIAVNFRQRLLQSEPTTNVLH